MPKATERIMSMIVSKVRKTIKGMDLGKSIRTLTEKGYPVKDSIRLAFMSGWNSRNSKRLLTLPLFIHTIHYVKYNEGKMVDVHSVKYVGTNKITSKQFDNIEKNKKDGVNQITLSELLETKRLIQIGISKLSYCLDDMYYYKQNEITEIETEQIL